MRQPDPRARRGVSAGFTLVELLVVMGIIAVAAALTIPNIAGYLRNSRIRAATSQLSGEIQAARNRAITKNVNLGVVFLTRSATTYQWAVEDDQNIEGGRSFVRPTVDTTFLNDTAQASPVYELPLGVEFSTTCPSPALPTGAWEPAMRFNRLGTWCNPTGDAEPCPAVEDDAGEDFVYNITSGNTAYPSGSVICLTQGSTGLRRAITVLGGGRVLAQR
jgi:prepilin-type N-terminal cleavage/methylation domain-containing protein